jgi:predicted alpha/beta superfamily hydrolase
MNTVAKNENVWVMDKAFFMPQLNRYRRIWIYVPPEYGHTKKHFPVLYMHDGQNLFDDATAFSEEWCVDETINANKEKCIVVGIDNGRSSRISEYSVHDTEHGKGEGLLYLEFIVQTLKPYIDQSFRTLPEPSTTGIAGSSLGGLISFYAGLMFPKVFGSIGVLSPSFWLYPHIYDEAARLFQQQQVPLQRMYFYGGKQESDDMVKGIKRMTTLMKTFPHLKFKQVINPVGIHSEIHWRDHFPAFYQWLITGFKAKSKA